MPRRITKKSKNSKTRKFRRSSKTSKNKPKRRYSTSKKRSQVKRTKTKTKRGGDDDDYDELRDPDARNHRLEQANKLNEEYYKEHGKWPWDN